MLDLISTAIEERKRLEINYDPGDRVVEPHAVGYGSEGQILLRAFQVSGVSKSGEHENWKLLRVDRLKAANDNGETFPGPREGYKKGDKAMTRGIIREL